MRDKFEKSLGYLKSCPMWFRVLLLGFATIVILFFMVFYSRSVSFSYSGNNCFRDPLFLPTLYESEKPNFVLKTSKTISVKGYPVYSYRTCVEPLRPPMANSKASASLKTKKLSLFQKRYAIKTGDLPRLNTANLGGKISIREPLKFNIDQPDRVFTYYLSAGGKSIICDQNSHELSCEVNKLGLSQGKEYSMSIERFFDGSKIEKVKENSVLTVEAVTITNSSITQNSIVYSSPTDIIITTNKPLASADIDLAQDAQKIEHTVLIKDSTITLKLSKPLVRKVKHSLTIKDAVAQDKAVLSQPQVISFTTSGGPRVVSTNIGRASVDPGKTIVINFDQPLQSNQDITKQINFRSGDTLMNYTVSVSGSQLILSPKTTLPVCSTFSINLSANIISEHNITGDSAWSIGSRLRCYTISTIGYSAQGRPIYAWKFGSGVSKVLYVGNLHGDEKSAKYTLDSWIQELDYSAEKIPANRSVIVIPSLNPDGFAQSTRKNARGVDLNRNFPANDWKSDVKMPNGEFAVGGGGSSPLSEPESQVLSSYILSQRPDRILSYHSKASIVSANGSGDSGALASIYSSLSGYWNMPESSSGSVFQYDTTGAFETWLYEKVGVPTLLMELSSHTSNEFSRNKSAMWRMLQ